MRWNSGEGSFAVNLETSVIGFVRVVFVHFEKKTRLKSSTADNT